MCGIVGYIGKGCAKDVVLDGLGKLEYRGYDSAGIALLDKGRLAVEKIAEIQDENNKSKIAKLHDILKEKYLDANVAIGHTRWATHGTPSILNAHPHVSNDGMIAVVHNGIVENYSELKEMLLKKHNIRCKSETDSEVIAQLLSVFCADGLDLVDAMLKATGMMKGAYAIGAIYKNDENKIVGYRKDAPLIACHTDEGTFIASDMTALLKHSKDVYFLDDDELVVCKADSMQILNRNKEVVEKEIFHIDWNIETAEKGGYDHFMLKEIHDQPDVLEDTLSRRLDSNGRINLDGISLTLDDLNKIKKIYIVACGTAYHAGLVGKTLIEKWAKIPVEVDVASEFRYRDPLVDENTLFIAVTQSGETLDTLMALREAKKKGARVLSIVNVVGSSIARESDDVFYTWAGPEIAVASTKGYTTQLMCLYLIALYMGRLKETISAETEKKVLEELKSVPSKVSGLLENEGKIEELAKKIYEKQSIFYIGRGLDANVALEGSLKLKEISYINSFAIAAGELKHGTIALMDEDTIVFALATQDELAEKMLSNIVEVSARDAYVVSITKEKNDFFKDASEMVLFIPECIDEVTPLLSIGLLQLIAYFVAKERGENIDMPRNLAKSVTVE